VLARLLSSFLIRYLSGEGDVRHIFVGLATDWRVLGFTAGLAVLTCVLVGLAPAIKSTGMAPALVMSLAGRGLTTTRERFSLRRALVVAQIAMSLVLVVSALLFGESLRKILTLDAGFQRDGVLVMDIDYMRLNLPYDQRGPFRERIVERVRSLPGVRSAAETNEVPLGGSYWNDEVVFNGEVKKGWVDMGHISPGYFQTIGTPLLAGRNFNERDTASSPKVAIVNQEFARKVMGIENPVGRTFKINVYQGQPQYEYEIVGLMANAKYDDLRKEFDPIAFYPQLQDDRPDTNGEIIVRSSGTLEPIVGELRQAMADLNPEIAIDFHSLAAQISDGLLKERLLAILSVVLWLAGRNSGNRRTLWSDGIHGGKKDKRDRDQNGIGRSADTNARTGSERGRKAVRSRGCNRGCGDASGREVGGVSHIWIEALQSRSTGDRVSGAGCGGGARQYDPGEKGG